jgi:hypothetical protein
MSKEINLQNIKNYIDGNLRYLKSKIANLEPHIQEQIEYRLYLCRNDCKVKGECINCGCNFPDRLYSFTTCNSARFPNLMNKGEWEIFKSNNINGVG